MRRSPFRRSKTIRLRPTKKPCSTCSIGKGGRTNAGALISSPSSPASRASAHLKAIHGHLFQDVYDWAGQVRTVEINKGGSQFQPVPYIETGMADVHKRIVAAKEFRGLGRDDFAKQAGQIMGDVNYAHPFREGNGRTQLQYLKQLAGRAGHSLDLEKIDRSKWMEASRQAHAGKYETMSQSIRGAITLDRDRTRPQARDRGGERER